MSAGSLNAAKELNRKKGREVWRPLAPVLLKSLANDMFDLHHTEESPFMTQAFHAKSMAMEHLPAAVHVDGTARVQTVCESQNPLLFNVLTEYKKLGGWGCINTSFNMRGEPIVEHPDYAIRSFLAMGIDHLVIGDYIVYPKYISIGVS